MKLHPSLHVSSLAAIWRRRRTLRIAPILVEADATGLLNALRAAPAKLVSTPPSAPLRYQYWTTRFSSTDAPDPRLSAAARWIAEDLRDVVRQITGLAVVAEPDARVLATLYGQGCYLDAHNDADGRRAVAYVLGLTPTPWPAEEGGHLEFFAQDKIIERRPPGWNCLDLFHVEPEFSRVHQVPLVQTHRERRALVGWFYLPPDKESEGSRV